MLRLGKILISIVLLFAIGGVVYYYLVPSGFSRSLDTISIIREYGFFIEGKFYKVGPQDYQIRNIDGQIIEFSIDTEVEESCLERIVTSSGLARRKLFSDHLYNASKINEIVSKTKDGDYIFCYTASDYNEIYSLNN